MPHLDLIRYSDSISTFLTNPPEELAAWFNNVKSQFHITVHVSYMVDIEKAGFAIEPESLEIKTVFCSDLKSNLLRHLSDSEVVQIKNRATEYINIMRNSGASMTSFGDF